MPNNSAQFGAAVTSSQHLYDIRRRKDQRGVDMISDALPFGRQRSGRSHAFRLLLVVAGALMLMAAFAPSARADLIAYFNFEDATVGSPPDFTSEADQGLGIATTITTNYLPGNMTTVPNLIDINRVVGDLDNPPFGLREMGSHTNRAQ